MEQEAPVAPVTENQFMEEEESVPAVAKGEKVKKKKNTTETNKKVGEPADNNKAIPEERGAAVVEDENLQVKSPTLFITSGT
jgi:hypothetical protein